MTSHGFGDGAYRAPFDSAHDAPASTAATRVEIPASSAYYPARLNDLTAPPAILHARGDVELLAAPSLAVVGARACTSYGVVVTDELIAGLVDLTDASGRRVIVSGGAYGIDAAAHRAALYRGLPTIVVVAGGVDRAYPAGHADLFERVLAAGGLIVSEHPDGTQPTRDRFLARNRLIAALGDGMVVVEAGRVSGSLNAARRARGLGRPLMAVPGPITSVTSRGTNGLIRDGKAVAVTSAADVLDTIIATQIAREVL